MAPQQAFYRRAADAPPSAWQVSGLLGFELELRGAVMAADSGSPVLAPNLYANGPNGASLTGDILRGAEKPYGYDPLGISITAGYRFLPFLSVGAFLDYASFQSNDGTDAGGGYADGTQGLQRVAWQLGGYVRLYGVARSAAHQGLPYLPGSAFNRVQPWIELGVGYTQDTATYTRGGNASTLQGGAATTDYALAYNGLVTNLRVGLDWRLAPIFSLGPVLGYDRVFALSGCADAEPQSDLNNRAGFLAANTCSGAASATNYATGPASLGSYGVIFGGLFAKVTLGPDVR